MALLPSYLNDLKQRQNQAALGGGQEKIDARHDKGMLSARERISALLDESSFLEMGMHAQHECHDFGMELKAMPGDGVVTGIGAIGGRSVALFSQDFSVGGGALGRIHSKKICEVMEQALECGMPFIAINDSGGARIQEGVDSLSGYGQVFYRNVQLSGLVPQIAIIAGPCAGGAAYSPALMDFLIMTRDNAQMFICGPEVIKAATGQDVSMAEIASAESHATISGNVHFIADNEQHALELTQKLLSFLPSNNAEDPPHRIKESIVFDDILALDHLVPDDSNKAMDMLKIIECIVDDADFLEVMQGWAKNLIIGFARIDGIVVGIVANQSLIKAGALDIDASDKGARFIRFCNAFNIPLVTLVDVPGFLPGVQQEKNGIIRHGAKMLFAYASATVPKITVITRRAYGGAYLAMCSQDMGADMVFAWPTAEIAVMGAEGAVNILYRKELSESEDKAALKKVLIQEYKAKFASPYAAAGKAMITDVIRPAQTRGIVSYALRISLSKRTNRPPKKHGLIPL